MLGAPCSKCPSMTKGFVEAIHQSVDDILDLRAVMRHRDQRSVHRPPTALSSAESRLLRNSIFGSSHCGSNFRAAGDPDSQPSSANPNMLGGFAELSSYLKSGAYPVERSFSGFGIAGDEISENGTLKSLEHVLDRLPV